jgi:type VI secretion system protein ImpA
MLDLTHLLEPATEAPPCGVNLEYEAPFKDIEKAATRVAPQEFGEHRTPGQEPKWPEVEELSRSFLERSKDVRVAVYLARALIQTEGFSGIAAGFSLIQELVQKYWDSLHPQLEEGDATMRVNALSALQDTEGVVPELRNALIINSREHGQLRVRDVEMAMGRLPAPEGANVPSMEQVHAQLAAAISAGNQTPHAVAEAMRALTELRKRLVERVTANSIPDFKPLFDILIPLKKVCDDVLAHTAGTDAVAEEGAADAAPMAQAHASGPIRSRQDALRMLDSVCAYLERHEPSNPAPLFIRRAQRLMSKSFLQIMEELLPDSLSNLERMAGKFDSAAPH